MITMIKNEGFNEKVEGNTVANIQMITKRKSTKSTKEYYDVFKRANEIGNKEYAFEDDSIYKSFKRLMTPPTDEEAYLYRENIGKAIKTLNETVDDIAADKRVLTMMINDETPKYIKMDIENRLKEISKMEIVHISMRDALVKMYDAYDIIINMH